MKAKQLRELTLTELKQKWDGIITDYRLKKKGNDIIIRGVYQGFIFDYQTNSYHLKALDDTAKLKEFMDGMLEKTAEELEKIDTYILQRGPLSVFRYE